MHDTREQKLRPRHGSKQKQKPLGISVLSGSSEPIGDSESFGGVEPFRGKV